MNKIFSLGTLLLLAGWDEKARSPQEQAIGLKSAGFRMFLI
jgi:hypothetical protein